MHAALAALAQRHRLGPEAVADLEALWRTQDGPSTLIEGYDPVDLEPDPELSARTEETELVGGRYADLGPIGAGGMGEVRRVRDTLLNRALAMKLIHPRLLGRPAAVARFLEEAQATAQLQHPGIVPVHDLGTAADGRLWFVMKEVRGRTLTEVAREVHAASTDRWNPGASGWTFRRLVTSFKAVCHAVAYAHERGVVHRDLKPDNVMVGHHGEVVVLDWGLAKVMGRRDGPVDDEAEGDGEDTVVSTRAATHPTRVGTVAGTPAYMAPEQARGEVDRIDARTDIYALGAMLYELLSGRPPYDGAAAAVLAQVRAGPPARVGRAGPAMTFGFGLTEEELEPSGAGPPIPDELVAACDRAMSRDPDRRFPTARSLAIEVEAWLDGARRREQASAVVERALARVGPADALLRRAAALRAEADGLLAGVASWRPAADKAPGWAKLALADAAERAAELEDLAVDETLRAALQVSADLPEAHAPLAERYRARHAAAEVRRDERAMAQAATLLQAHAAALPSEHEVRREAATYLEGTGALTLVTDPPGAEVLLYRYVERDRRLQETFERPLGRTPLRAVPIAMGSYLCVVRHPDRVTVRYPVRVERRGHWDGIAPGAREAHPVRLPLPGELGAEDCLVPAGWFASGGDAEAASSLPARRLWCHELVVQRQPVTNRQYMAFLDDLVATGREREALRHAPKEKASGEGPPLYSYEHGRFGLRPDADGDLWDPEWAVTQVDWFGARAYLAWLAERTGRPWRLPAELEWEKAARGVDGRWFPWGDFLDPSWCLMSDSHPARRLPAVVDSYPTDVSPCGARGFGGNVRDACLDLFEEGHGAVEGDRVTAEASEGSLDGLRVVRGGAWDSHVRIARVANRSRNMPTNRLSNVGFRGVFIPEAQGPPGA